jgi:hypothetical protein
MFLEAVDRPIRYEWPEGEIRLTPGQPVLVPSDRGLKILKKCGAKVRAVSPFVVGDSIAYRVPGDPEEGPFEVVEITESHGQWWALVAKNKSHAWIPEVLVVKEEQR